MRLLYYIYCGYMVGRGVTEEILRYFFLIFRFIVTRFCEKNFSGLRFRTLFSMRMYINYTLCEGRRNKVKDESCTCNNKMH